MPLLCARGVSFAYNERRVLEDISFTLDAGEVLGLVGPNGSGKTTLIRCLDRILDPEGEIHLDGRDMLSMSRPEIARMIAYVPQNSGILSSATVFETVLMGRRPHLRWSVSEEDKQTVSDALSLLGISAFASRRIDRLSGGERQRVFIARALAQDARVLLLDEPTSALDLRHQLEVMQIIRSVVDQKGIGGLMAIHDLNLAARYCDRVVVLHQGRIAGQGKPSAILTEELIRNVYGVSARVGREDGYPLIVPLEPVASV